MENGLIALQKKVIEKFKSVFGDSPEAMAKAPGRVNIIGEYTDFNNGFVLPMAIDRYMAVALKKRSDNQVRVVSIDFNQEATISLDTLPKGDHSWVEYISGSLWALKQHRIEPTGFECVMAGNIPVGAGLSSSAALEMAILKSATWCSGIELDNVQMAKIGRYVENEWVGVACGIMDQMISSAGRAGHALLIDCADLSLHNSPIPENSSIIVLDTNTRRGLVDSAYNERREQCFKAASVMGVDYLRNADLNLLEENSTNMDPLVYKRAKHIISENQRVKEAAHCMDSNEFERLGKLMYQSHESLRDDFEVSSEALNCIVESAMTSPGCYGARMTGAGFGGCAVALVKKGHEEDFMSKVTTDYKTQSGNDPILYNCKASGGVTIETDFEKG